MNVLLTVSLASLILLAGPQSAPTALVKIDSHRYGKEIFIRTVKFEKDDACVNFNAGMSAGDFFNHLERVTTSTGIVFRKQSQTIDDYPPSITVRFIATANLCSALPRLNPPPASVIPVLDSAHFIARCGKDPDEKHLQVSEKQKHLVPGALSTKWFYTLEVHSQGCSLGEPLSIGMNSDDGMLITQFFAQL